MNHASSAKTIPCPPAQQAGGSPPQASAYRCPICQAAIPPEQMGRKLWCRRCGYLESCCNPEG